MKKTLSHHFSCHVAQLEIFEIFIIEPIILEEFTH